MVYGDDDKKKLIEKYENALLKIAHCRHHHTHSYYEYNDDGIAINKGNWLKNENPKGKNGIPIKVIKVKDLNTLNNLLIKQCAFEIACGYIKCDAELKYYLIEYFCNSMDCQIDIDIESEIDNVIKYVKRKCCINKKKMKDDSKVHISPKIKDKSLIGKLSRKGQKLYYDYYIEKFVNKYLGKDKTWYYKHSDKCEIKVSERRIREYFNGK